MAKLELMKMIGDGKPILNINEFYVTVDDLSEYESGMRGALRDVYKAMKRRRGLMAESHTAGKGMSSELGTNYAEFVNPMLTLTRVDLVGYDYNGFKFSKPNYIDVKQAFIVCFNNTDNDSEVEVIVHSRYTEKTIYMKKFVNENVERVVNVDVVALKVTNVETNESRLIVINHNGVVGETVVPKEEYDPESGAQIGLLAVVKFSSELYGMILGESTRIYADNRAYSTRVRVRVLKPSVGEVLCEPKRYSGALEIKTGIKITGDENSGYYRRTKEVTDEKVNRAIENWLKTVDK